MRAELNMFWTWNSIRNAWFMKNDLRIFQPLNSHSGWKWAWHIYFFVCVCACFFAIRAHFFLHTHCVTLQMWIWMHAGWLFCSVNLHIIVHTHSLSLCFTQHTRERERGSRLCKKVIVNSIFSTYVNEIKTMKWCLRKYCKYKICTKIHSAAMNVDAASTGFGVVCL